MSELNAETELDISMALHRIERVMDRMPAGGTYFTHRFNTLNPRHSQPTLERLKAIEGNLEDLADGLADHFAENSARIADAQELRNDLRALGRLIKRVTEAT